MFGPTFSLRRLSAAGLAALAVSAATPAHAAETLLVEGVEDGALNASLRSALVVRDPPQSIFEAERQSEEAAARAEIWLRAEGFYQGAAEASPLEGKAARARIRVTLGERFRFAEPAIVYDGVAPPEAVQTAARQALTAVAQGQPARSADVLAAESALVAALKAEGFAEAAARPRTAIVDHAAKTMALTLRIDPGAALALGALKAQPADLLDPDYIARLAGWREGAPADPGALAAARRALISTGAFARVDVALAPAPNTDGRRDVIASLMPAKPRTLELGASWSSTEGAAGDAGWSLKNRFRRAEELRLGLTLAEREQAVRANLFFPHAAGLGRARRISVDLKRENARPFDRLGAAISTAVEAQSGLDRALTYGVTLSADDFTARSGVGNAIVLSGFASLREDTADDRFDPKSGHILEARIEPSVSTGAADLAFARAILEGRAYFSPGTDDRFTLAARARTGWIAPFSGSADDLPLDRLFYAGGGGSVRGYAFRSIFPNAEDQRTEPPGGQGLLEASAEVRARFAERWGAAAFVDAGAAFDRWGAMELRTGIGVGVRYDLGFAPLRVDVAAPLDRRERDNPVAIYVSLGQAF